MENSSPEQSPANIAINNALAKAIAISVEYPDSMVISADTVVVLDNVIMGKPANLLDATKMLGSLSGKTHMVITGIALVHGKSGTRSTDYESTEVTFRNLTLEQIDNYTQDKKPLDKAGSYGIQEIGEEFIESLDGGFENVMGLPVELVAEMIFKFLQKVY